MISTRALGAMIAMVWLSGCGGGSPSAPTTPTSVASDTSLTTVVASSAISQRLTIDLASVASYGFGVLPAYYDATVSRLDNGTGGIDDRVATLGRVLFYDKALSVNDTVSCASCHQQAFGFSDASRFSAGFQGVSAMTAHAPRLGNVRYYQPGTMFWNKRAATLEAQATVPVQDAFEMGFTAGNGGIGALVTKLGGTAYYPELFTFAVGSALITAQENRGRALFMGNAGANVTCSTCHVPPTFALVANARGIGLDAGETTVFKAPSLKNVGLTGPYMHDGRFATLERVLQHYDNGIQAGPALDDRFRTANGGVRRFALSAPDRDALVAFLRTLTDTSLTTDPRFGNPFR